MHTHSEHASKKPNTETAHNTVLMHNEHASEELNTETAHFYKASNKSSCTKKGSLMDVYHDGWLWLSDNEVDRKTDGHIDENFE